MSVALQRAVTAAIARHAPIRRLLVGFSGGADSTGLLALLADGRASSDIALEAVHVNHALHPEAANWEDHCRQTCERLAVPLRVLRVRVHRQGDGLEAAARRARYRAIAELVAAGDVVVTGHTRDDQAETVLLQLMRGSGPTGLAAMVESRPLGSGRLLRPLLSVPRDAMCELVQARGLEVIQDPSNRDPTLSRAWVRHRLLPLLRTRWPGSVATLARSARLCRESVELLEQLASQDLEACREGETLSVAALLDLPRSRARLLLRSWIDWRGADVPSEHQVERMLIEVAPARCDAQPVVAWSSWEVRRHRGCLHLVQALPAPPAPDISIALRPDAWARWPGGGLLRLRSAGTSEPLALAADALEQGVARATPRHPGDRLQPDRLRPRRRLKDLLRELEVPPWWRERLPVLRVDGRAVAVPGLLVEASYRPAPDARGVVFEWQCPGPSDRLLPTFEAQRQGSAGP